MAAAAAAEVDLAALAYIWHLVEEIRQYLPTMVKYVNINTRLLRSLYQYTNKYVLSLLAKPSRKIVHGKKNWPSAMGAAHVSKRINSIST